MLTELARILCMASYWWVICSGVNLVWKLGVAWLASRVRVSLKKWPSLFSQKRFLFIKKFRTEWPFLVIYTKMYVYPSLAYTEIQWRRPGAEFWGDRKCLADKDFCMMSFSEKISIFTAKIYDDLFLVIDQVFQIFPFFSQIFRILVLC